MLTLSSYQRGMLNSNQTSNSNVRIIMKASREDQIECRCLLMTKMSSKFEHLFWLVFWGNEMPTLLSSHRRMFNSNKHQILNE